MKKLRKRIKELAIQHDIPESVVQKAFESQFRMAREVISVLQLTDLSEQEFNEIKTNFNWKHIGKYKTNYAFVQKIKKKWEKQE